LALLTSEKDSIFLLINSYYVPLNHFSGSTITAIESWLMVCIFFIFATMLEYGFLVLLSRMKHKKNEDKISNKVHSKYNLKLKSESNEMDENQLEKMVDKISLGLSVFLFALYNIIYWRYHF